MARFSSRKFLLCLVVVLSGIASFISGICTDNATLLIVGAVCSTLASCLYGIIECICDTAAIEEEGTVEIVAETDDTDEDGDGEAVG